MPFPRTLARINRRVTNPVARRFAGRLPPFAIMEHRGRRSGATHRTPVMAFRSSADDGFVVALTYGPEADWVRNVLAEGGCAMEYGRRRIVLVDPTVVPRGSPGPVTLPRPVRLALRLLRVADELRLRRAA